MTTVNNEKRRQHYLELAGAALRKAMAPPGERKLFVIEVIVSTVQHWTVEAYHHDEAVTFWRSGQAQHWPDKDFVEDECVNAVREPHASEGF